MEILLFEVWFRGRLLVTVHTMKCLWLLVLTHKWPTCVSWQTNSCGCAFNEFSLIGRNSKHQLTPFDGVNVVVDRVQYGRTDCLLQCSPVHSKLWSNAKQYFQYSPLWLLYCCSTYSHERLLSIKTTESNCVPGIYVELTCDPPSLTKYLVP